MVIVDSSGLWSKRTFLGFNALTSHRVFYILYYTYKALSRLIRCAYLSSFWISFQIENILFIDWETSIWMNLPNFRKDLAIALVHVLTVISLTFHKEFWIIETISKLFLEDNTISTTNKMFTYLRQAYYIVLIVFCLLNCEEFTEFKEITWQDLQFLYAF